MSRRKDNSPAISFFSFQDIITSVTGIMFLVVLILILMLLMRNELTPVEREEASRTEALKAELARMQEELAAAAGSVASLEKRLAELEKLNLDECPARIAALNRHLQSLEQETQMAVRQTQEARKHQEHLKKEREVLERKLQQAESVVKEAQGKEVKLTKKVKEMESKLQESKKRVRFTWNRSSGKTPLLVECGKDTILVGYKDSATPVKSFKATNPLRLCDNFMKWVETMGASKYHVLLLVKPGAFPYAEHLSTLLLDKGFERGREVLPNDDVMIFSGKEAGK